MTMCGPCHFECFCLAKQSWNVRDKDPTYVLELPVEATGLPADHRVLVPRKNKSLSESAHAYAPRVESSSYEHDLHMEHSRKCC